MAETIARAVEQINKTGQPSAECWREGRYDTGDIN